MRGHRPALVHEQRADRPRAGDRAHPRAPDPRTRRLAAAHGGGGGLRLQHPRSAGIRSRVGARPLPAGLLLTGKDWLDPVAVMRNALLAIPSRTFVPLIDRPLACGAVGRQNSADGRFKRVLWAFALSPITRNYSPLPWVSCLSNRMQIHAITVCRPPFTHRGVRTACRRRRHPGPVGRTSASGRRPLRSSPSASRTAWPSTKDLHRASDARRRTGA